MFYSPGSKFLLPKTVHKQLNFKRMFEGDPWRLIGTLTATVFRWRT